MNKLQNLVYKPIATSIVPPQARSDEEEDPATPMAKRIPLSHLMMNTPLNLGGSQDISPEKVVWKLSPKEIVPLPFGSPENVPPNMTTFLNLLNEGDMKKSQNKHEEVNLGIVQVDDR